MAQASFYSLPSVFFLWCVLQLNWSGGNAETNYLAKEKQVLDSLLHQSRYDARVRPVGINGTGRDPPTNVSVNLYLSAITNIDDIKMKFTVQMLLRQRWSDPRLTFDDYGGKLPYLSLTDKNKIWLPDLFFPGEIGGFVHSVLGPNSFIRILNARVFTSNRKTPNVNRVERLREHHNVYRRTMLSLTLSCPMDLRWYPFDTQVCDLQIESYGMNSKDLILSWDHNTPVVQGILKLPRFSLEKMETTTTHSKTKTGEYNGLKLNLFFKRHLTTSVLQAFIPSAMLVIVSWMSFCLDTQAVVARVIIGVGTLFAACTHSFAFNWSTPSVDYVTSLDIWFGTCLLFLFAALLMSILVNWQSRAGANKPVKSDSSIEVADVGKKSTIDKKRTRGIPEENGFPMLQTLKTKLPNGPSRLDFISRIIFPLGFVTFNVFYWAINLCHSEYE